MGGRRGERGGTLKGPLQKGYGNPKWTSLFFESPEELDNCVILLVNGWHICFHVNMNLLGWGVVLLVFFLIPPFAFCSGGEGGEPFKNQNSVGRVDPLFWRWRWCHDSYKLSPALPGFSYIRISNIHTCHGCRVIFEILFTLKTIKTWVTHFPIMNLSILLHNFYLIILSFFHGGGGRG